MTTSLRYPIGEFTLPEQVSEDERKQYIVEIAQLPQEIRQAIDTLSDEQLNTPYRDGGWTVRQVVHHLPDQSYECLHPVPSGPHRRPAYHPALRRRPLGRTIRCPAGPPGAVATTAGGFAPALGHAPTIAHRRRLCPHLRAPATKPNGAPGYCLGQLCLARETSSGTYYEVEREEGVVISRWSTGHGQ